MTLRICEIFKSFQGEGRSCGKLAVFLRLAKCNAPFLGLECIKWCDTKYSWEEGKEYTVNDIINLLIEYNVNRVVLTGGEPLLQIDGIIELLNELNYGVNYVEIETNGTIPYNDDLMLQSCLDIITISPKRELKSGKYLVHSAWFEYSHISPEIIWKFVVSNEEDVKEVKRFVDENDLIESNVYLMPKVIKSEEHNDLLRKVAEWGLKYNFNISPRLQIALWGNVKGR